MNVEEIRRLIRLMEEAGLTELEIEDRAGKVRLVRGGARRPGSAVAAEPSDLADPTPPTESAIPFGNAGTPEAAGRSDPASAPIPPGMTAITSPMVGTFYRAPAPDAPPFVSPGDVVQPGQVVCIIEAMKMMNEVCAETAARIVSVQAENGAPVEYGSSLFLVELLE